MPPSHVIQAKVIYMEYEDLCINSSKDKTYTKGFNEISVSTAKTVLNNKFQ